ncbi:porin [Parasegetibacter sp. NRK P23]|uniref:porin n=1 Tax=Parasegetibacter sp. NRK P23 TaxID=2942999 RepID=UPI002043E1F4|nr:porin [Parasegetibacter sp. NRK P23]MCM5526856.1 porin [Parasegetibacter sp. NRK P23]
MRPFLFFACLFAGSALYAQDSTNRFSVSGYVEAYYSYDLNKPASNTKPSFLYSHNRHNEFNINLAFLKANYQTNKVRANLAIAAGTYMNANYAAEPGVLKNVFEANAGMKLSKQYELWLDVGIFPSHIGFESAISKDCPTLTRSILAENSPYYQSGAKLSYNTPNGKWLLSVLALNGWQRIQRVESNSLMSFGTQVQFKPNTNTLLNSSTFIGTDQPDTTRLMRYFHNLYAVVTSGKTSITTGFDIGAQQRTKGSNDFQIWYAPVIIARYTLNEQWSLNARGEYYSDQKGVIVAANTPGGFKTFGYSVGMDFSPVPNAIVRLEGRGFTSKDKLFERNGEPVSGNGMLNFSIAVAF